jgi:hypothetical protein
LACLLLFACTNELIVYRTRFIKADLPDMDTLKVIVDFDIDFYRQEDYYIIDSLNFQALNKGIIKSKLDLDFYKEQILNYNQFKIWYEKKEVKDDD